MPPKHAVLTWLLFLSVGDLSIASGRIVESVAGTGAEQNNGDAGASDQINVGQPFGVEFGPDGALYITEVKNHRILRLDLKTKTLTTVAGNGQRGYSGDGGPATKAELNEPYEVRFDREGNMYFVEMRNHVIRRVDAKSNAITTVAGTGEPGFGGDGGPATKALLNQPHSIALDPAGAIYVADIGNHRIRRIDPKTGNIDSIAGNAERSLPRDGQTAHGNPILGPRALFVHGHDLWIALREGHSMWRLNLRDGKLPHVAGTGKAAYTGDDGPAKDATFNGPKGIVVAENGDVYVADSGNNAVRRIDHKTHLVTTAVGSSRGARADNESLNALHGICLGADGAIFIGDTMNHRVLRARSAE